MIVGRCAAKVWDLLVNNAIIWLELANQIYAQEDCDRPLPILKAAPQRPRPHSNDNHHHRARYVAFGLGLVRAQNFCKPLGVVVFSGHSLATVLTLFIIPCFYTLLHGGSHRHITNLLGRQIFSVDKSSR